VDWPTNLTGILFVKTRDGKPVSEALAKRIRAAIAKALSTRQVPSVIISALDIPYTSRERN